MVNGRTGYTALDMPFLGTSSINCWFPNTAQSFI